MAMRARTAVATRSGAESDDSRLDRSWARAMLLRVMNRVANSPAPPCSMPAEAGDHPNDSVAAWIALDDQPRWVASLREAVTSISMSCSTSSVEALTSGGMSLRPRDNTGGKACGFVREAVRKARFSNTRSIAEVVDGVGKVVAMLNSRSNRMRYIA